jgi:hypothetical protein
MTTTQQTICPTNLIHDKFTPKMIELALRLRIERSNNTKGHTAYLNDWNIAKAIAKDCKHIHNEVPPFLTVFHETSPPQISADLCAATTSTSFVDAIHFIENKFRHN